MPASSSAEHPEMVTAESLTEREPTRLMGLDLLRILAVALVLGRHMETPPTEWATAAGGALLKWHNFGGLGVDLFFVLSGFLVSGLLFAEYRKRGQISLSRFYFRRGWRIYPPFFLMMAFTWIYQLTVVGDKIRDRNFFAELFFLQSYREGWWNHTWTLAVEEHFYLLMPLLILYLARRGGGAADPFRAVPALVVGFCATMVLVRYVNYQVRTEFSLHTHIYASHLRMDELFSGVAIAYAYHFHRERFVNVCRPLRHLFIFLGAAILFAGIWAPVRASHMYICCGLFTQSLIGSGLLMVGVLMCEIPRNLSTRVLAALGAQSYSIYLWHMALMRWGIPHLQELPWIARTAIYMIGAFAIGLLMAKICEAPLLKLRDRMYPSRTAEASGAALATDKLRRDAA